MRQPSWVEEMYAELTVCPGLPAEDVEVKMGDRSDMETVWEQRPLFAKSVADIFSVDECEIIKRAALAVGLTRATVRGKAGQAKQMRLRTNDLAKLPRAENEWIYERVLDRSQAVNDQYWRFSVTDIQEVQVLRYRRMQFFKWHFDTAIGLHRKLTCIFNLSPPDAYWRGGLELRGHFHDGKVAARLQGAGTWFPTYLQHRAKAPWWGERWVLITWLTGPPWV